MAEGVDIDLYDNLEEDFNQVRPFYKWSATISKCGPKICAFICVSCNPNSSSNACTEMVFESSPSGLSCSARHRPSPSLCITLYLKSWYLRSFVFFSYFILSICLVNVYQTVIGLFRLGEYFMWFLYLGKKNWFY